ncbi:hypothetical protein AVEN_179431-1 [Araneus ventricosus]|uniref:Uncharacterized protein n=1 Tax=Araneus ventricosus TaxID=182803 RepID=A0A4Y2BEP5_ARAVE|nr:hypothetical protein AVEN_179431-1 [Araneus ventricosus]
MKVKNDFIDDSSSDMEVEGDASSGSSISDANTAVSILQNFFATETVDKNLMYSFLIIDKKVDEMYLKSRVHQSFLLRNIILHIWGNTFAQFLFTLCKPSLKSLEVGLFSYFVISHFIVSTLSKCQNNSQDDFAFQEQREIKRRRWAEDGRSREVIELPMDDLKK